MAGRRSAAAVSDESYEYDPGKKYRRLKVAGRIEEARIKLGIRGDKNRKKSD